MFLDNASKVATEIRQLPIPTFCVAHGKLIGGGLALALATDWRVCASDATFNFGNLPRGKNPLFMLSRSLTLSLGHGAAFKVCIEWYVSSVK